MGNLHFQCICTSLASCPTFGTTHFGYITSTWTTVSTNNIGNKSSDKMAFSNNSITTSSPLFSPSSPTSSSNLNPGNVPLDYLELQPCSYFDSMFLDNNHQHLYHSRVVQLAQLVDKADITLVTHYVTRAGFVRWTFCLMGEHGHSNFGITSQQLPRNPDGLTRELKTIFGAIWSFHNYHKFRPASYHQFSQIWNNPKYPFLVGLLEHMNPHTCYD